MAERKYDIFISYRRVGGAQYARILQLMLMQRGYKVFLDYDELKDGVFGKRIKAAIAEAPVFILVLSKDSLDRCANADDWVREEITYAQVLGKHFVPVNPDKSFDGIHADVPDVIKAVALDNQHSEVDFGQALGATVEVMIANRLVPTLGKRQAMSQIDEDGETARETLRRIDARNRFIKRLSICSAIVVIALVLATCLWFWRHQQQNDKLQRQRIELQEKYEQLGLQLSPELTELQLNAIGELMESMVPVRPDSLWMSQFEFTVGLWHGIKNEPCDLQTAHLPKTDVSYGEVSMMVMDLADMTNVAFALPSADEWQYAAAGGSEPEGTTYAGSNQVDEVAWYKGNSAGRAHPSDGRQGLQPNVLDLYDMSGNVGEWCATPSDGNRYTVCGGSYNSPATQVTVGSRQGQDVDAKDKATGFRLVIRKV